MPVGRHGLDYIALKVQREPLDETNLPPSRSSLTSYALEYDGALRMIRVYVFSNDLMTRVMPGGKARAGLYNPKGPM